MFQYVLAHQSGRAFWESVYKKFSAGSIDICLPKVVLTCEARGYIRGYHFAVETLAIEEIEAMEDPLPCYSEIPKTFHFSQSSLAPRGPMSCKGLLTLIARLNGEQEEASRPKQVSEKPQLRGEYPCFPGITDREWRKIRKLLESADEDDLAPDTLRWCLEAVLHVEITGVSFYATLLDWERPFVCERYKAWKRSGVLETIKKKLADTRQCS